jgi:excisionase family DNA binding protein
MNMRVLYTAEEAAEQLSLSRSTVDVLVARGELRAVRIGRLVRIAHRELERFAACNHYEVWGSKADGKTVRPQTHAVA